MENFLDFVTQISGQYAENVAFEIRRKIRRERVYYSELPGIISKFENFFKKNNIKEGDRIMVWGLNCPEYSLLLLACFTLNRTVVPIDFRTSNEVLSKIITQVNPKICFVSKYLKSDFIKNHVSTLYIIEDIKEYVEKFAADTKEFPASYIKPSNISEIVYTSGTTGIPKGVVLSQSIILANLIAINKNSPVFPKYETVSILPLSHMLEQIAGLLLVLYRGGKIIYLPRINSLKILQALQENKISHLTFVPQLFNVFMTKIRQKAFESNKLHVFDFLLKLSKTLPIFFRKIFFKDVHNIFGSSFHTLLTGGAPLNINIARDWEAMGFNIFEGYGATEVVAVASMNNHKSKRLGSVGKPLDTVNVSLDASNQIVIKSPSVALGYLDNPDKTCAVFKDGSYYTGDIGKFDSDGYLYIVGRDAFKIVLPGGEKVYVEDLETKINSNEYIKDSCVVEFAGDAGAEVFACLIIDDHREVKNPEEIIKDINERLESKQQIRRYMIWKDTDFPRTHTLKIDRNRVKDMVNKSTTNIPETSVEAISAGLSPLDIISRVSGVPLSKINENDNLSSDLLLDSISRVELLAQIEEYLGVFIDETTITMHTCVKDIVKACETVESFAKDAAIPKWQFTSWGLKISNLLRKVILYPFHSFIVDLDVQGIENLENLNTGFITVFNHAGILDGVCLLRVFQNAGYTRPFTLASKSFWEKDTFVNKFVRVSLEALAGGLPLYESGHAFIKILQRSSDLLDEKSFMLYAPQGRLQRSVVQDPFNAGIGYIAKEVDKPLIPIKLVGYEKIWPAPSSKIHDLSILALLPKKRGKVTIKIGKPIYADKSKSPMEIANVLEETLLSL